MIGDERPLVALLGEDRGHRSHLELNALRPRLDVATEWVPSDSGFSIEEYDGVWLVPGSPYADDAAVLRALTTPTRRQCRRELPRVGANAGARPAVAPTRRSADLQ